MKNKSDRVNLVAPASPIECLLYEPKIRAIQYKLGPERLTRFVNSNVLLLPVRSRDRDYENPTQSSQLYMYKTE